MYCSHKLRLFDFLDLFGCPGLRWSEELEDSDFTRRMTWLSRRFMSWHLHNHIENAIRARWQQQGRDRRALVFSSWQGPVFFFSH